MKYIMYTKIYLNCHITQVESSDYPGNFPDTFEEDVWNFDTFVDVSVILNASF